MGCFSHAFPYLEVTQKVSAQNIRPIYFLLSTTPTFSSVAIIQMSNHLKRLIEAKEKEQNELEILLSKRRKRNYEKEQRAVDQDPTTGSGALKRSDINEESLLAEIWERAVELHSNWSNTDILEKAFTFLTLNSIINLEYDYCSMANIDKMKWEEYQKQNAFSLVSFKKFSLTTPVSAIKRHLEVGADENGSESEGDEHEYVASKKPGSCFLDCCAKLYPIAKSTEELKYYRIYSHLLTIFEFQQSSLDSWRQMSETDIFRVFFSHIFEIVFEGSPIKLRTGETENIASKDIKEFVRSGGDHSMVRGAYKVDLRLVHIEGKKQHDVGNCEFAKDGNLLKKIVTDNIKVIAEAKCIMDHIVHVGRLSKKHADKLKVVNLQACGLKMRLISLKLDKNGNGYVAQSVGKTIRFPHKKQQIGEFFDIAIPQIYYLKEIAEKNGRLIQDGLNRDSSEYGSASPEQVSPFLKRTWLGPKPSRPNNPPPLPYTS